jgi:glycosyltransferase involved in cell wall biosynthesis
LRAPTVTVFGSQPFEVLKQHYAQCRALIFPGEEDFGMVPVKAMASGPPLRSAEAARRKPLQKGVSGVFFRDQSVETISSAVKDLANIEIEPEKIAAYANELGRDQFFQQMRTRIDRLLAEKDSAH